MDLNIGWSDELKRRTPVKTVEDVLLFSQWIVYEMRAKNPGIELAALSIWRWAWEQLPEKDGTESPAGDMAGSVDTAADIIKMEKRLRWRAKRGLSGL